MPTRLADPDTVQEGNEGVIRARYADAEFFFRQDTAKPLDSFTERLGTLTFHAKLGSMLEKLARLQTLAPQIARMLGVEDENVETTRQAAALCKSDLVTSMVVEMTSLQGVMVKSTPKRAARRTRRHRRFGNTTCPASTVTPSPKAGRALP